MRDLNVDCDSASCSSVSSTEDASMISQRSPAEPVSRASVSSMQNVQISTVDAERMIHPSVNTVTPSSGAAKLRRSRCLSQSSSSESDCREKPSRRKRQKDKVSPEEEEKRRLRRERNKIAAAKCRNRRRELTERLEAETDKLEEEKATLQTEIDNLMREKAQLEMALSTHEPTCTMTQDEEEIQQSLPSPQQHLTPVLDLRKAPEVLPSLQDLEMHSSGMPSTTAILGNSNILLCSSAVGIASELEAFLGMREESLRDLSSESESSRGHDMAPAVPDIDLTNSLGISDWETLYKSMADNLEILTSPTVISSPTCGSTLHGFEFNYPDFDSLTEDCECGSQIKNRSDVVKDILNSPTLLAL